MDHARGINTNFVDMALPGADFKYYENFLSRELADFYLETFMQMPFLQGRVSIGTERRKSCFYSELRNTDGGLRDYYYAGKQNVAFEFTDELNVLKNSVELVGHNYNSCLVNLYETGKNVIGWHSDSEKSLKKYSAIASISLGAERWFDVRGKPDTPYENIETSIRMKHGSLMIMAGHMQDYYKHQVRQEARIKEPRINLTFRLSK